MVRPPFPRKYDPIDGKWRMFGFGSGKRNGLFDAEYYAFEYSAKDSSISLTSAYDHFYSIGVYLKFNPNAYFDTDWYLNQYRDVADSKQNPLDHYLKYGRTEGRNPSRRFSTLMYLALYPDVAQNSEMNPLLHFLTLGRDELRQPVPVDFLPPAERNKHVLGAEWLIYTKRLGIDHILERSTDWFDRFWIWTNVRRELACNSAQEGAIMPPSYDSVVTRSRTGPGIPGDFLPSSAVSQLVLLGINLYLAKQNELVIIDESAINLLIDESSDLSEKLEGEITQMNIAREISVRLWRQLFFVANTLSKSPPEEVQITDNGTFAFAVLTRLEPCFPLRPSSRPIFFRMLHADLFEFVRTNEIVSGEWGSLRLKNDSLILAA